MSGLFIKKANNQGAIWGVIWSIPIAMFFKIAPKGWSDAAIFPNLPFLHQMMITAVLSLVIIYVVSHITGKGEQDEKAIPLTKKLFETSQTFNISATLVLIITAVLYALFW